MFVQIIRGSVHDEREALGMLDRWRDEVMPDAIGWLGSTGGVTPDGELLVLARFGSVEEAQQNGDRREQTAWWEEMEKQFSGPVRFHDCADVAAVLDGGDDSAGFVQIMECSSDGTLDAAQIAEVTSRLVRQWRPDVLGGLIAVADDDTIFQAVYFTSEQAARRAEAEPMPDEASEEMQSLLGALGELQYHDLLNPQMMR